MESSSPQAGVVLIYVPCGSEEEAVRIARTLLTERLIACGNIYQSRSLYIWENRPADEQEYVLVCKTAPVRADATRRRIDEMHSYKVPGVLTMQPAEANYAYSSWVSAQVTGPNDIDLSNDNSVSGEA